MARIDRSFGDVEAYADARWTRVEQGQQSAPVKDSLQLPVGHPDNRGPGIMTIYDYTFADLGPVRDTTVSISRFLTLGLRGAWGDGEWDIHVNDQHNDSSDELMGLLREDTFAEAVRKGAFHIDTVNAEAVRSAISPVLHRRAETTQSGISGHVSRPVAELPGGAATVAIGVEAYRDRLHDAPDPLILTSRVFQFQTPSIRSEDRWSSAAYIESLLPVMHRFDVDVAWRFDRSKGYGHAWSPKVGLNWKAMDGLSIRGTWARGYRAPTLLQLNHPATLASVGFLTQVPNNVLPCAEGVLIDRYSSYCELRLNSISNPQLKAETSSSYTLGLVWAPSDTASVALDYFRIRRDNDINALPIPYVLTNPERYPRLFERNANHELVALNQQLTNLGKTDARVIDLESRYRFEPGRVGRFDIRFDVNYLKRLDRTIVSGMPVDHYAGYASQPRWTALLGIDWRYRDWTTTANVRYTGAYRYPTSSASFQTCPDYLATVGKCTTPAFVLVDLNLAYAGIRDWTVALNVHNLFDHSPAYYGSPGTAYNPLFDDVVGRAYQLSFTWHPH
ncbi:MAG: Colicin I receptor [Luteibacter sp.]|nr:MAG: Colicin I receptor [Luteibacter sp.]